MKKVLGLAILMMVMLMSVSGLAVSDTTESIPVYLNVPEFVSITASPAGQSFDLGFDIATEQATSDTVTLVAEANVGYIVDASIAYQSLTIGSGTWGSLVDIDISLPSSAQSPTPVISGTFGSAGICEFVASADISILNFTGFLEQGAITTTPGTKIADVTFTISSTN
jgi:hypothetical protein